MKKAFTLIELLVVVLIIGILSAIALPQYQKAIYKARMAEVAVRVKAMEQTMSLYALEKGFPTSGAVDLFEVNPDLASGLTKVPDDDAGLLGTVPTPYYASKYVWYAAYCNSTDCELHAYFSKSGNPSRDTAILDITHVLRKLNKTNGWQTGKCWWCAGGDKYGPAICSVIDGYIGESD